MLGELTQKMQGGAHLEGGEAEAAARMLADDGLGLEKRAAFLEALSAKGETAEEIEGFARVFLEMAEDPGVDARVFEGPTLDIVGTGGDRLNLFNVSTSAMFVLAGGGVVMLKHGNRAITSRSGGADVLEALGVRLEVPPARFAEVVRETGLGFLFAPVYHPAFRAIGPVRKHLAERGVRTIFNLLGPLLNPARPEHQLIGVGAESVGPVFREQMKRMDRKRAWVVYGRTEDGRGMDEVSLCAPSLVWSWERGAGGREFSVDAGDVGLGEAGVADLCGGDAEENAKILLNVLDGSERGACRRMCELNAAAGFVVAGLAGSLSEGVELALESIESGRALAKVGALVEATQRHSS